ncbi:hypothetical protein GCM10010324_32230 [Streptomyces hiroshimensis]|uniref:Uncharacterized protein n=1 Tax=Streptomyces hiroshimensis TaxID=66424 RepID=A0ABQ2YK70_9ACTN|nr:hypothetical protein GCM10010324_32230 [Streptomyces hiroshimensis]
MEARPFLLIFLAANVATRRNWHLPRREPRRVNGETGWRVAGASTGRVPLPLWMSGMALGEAQAFVHAATPDIGRRSALFKTVTEGTAR